MPPGDAAGAAPRDVRMFRANVAFDDQPFARRMAGHIDTVTVESVMRFVHQVDLRSHDIDLK